MLQVCRVLYRLCGAVCFVSSLAAIAQQPQSRLTRALEQSPRSVLAHSRSPRVSTATDLGPVPSDMPAPGITLVFRRSASQEAALQQLLSQLQTPGSAQFRRWLTPESFAARFGVADADIEATENWLTSEGFHVESVARSRDRITFSGTAAQVQRAFGAELHHYRVEGAVHFAPASDLTLPAELGAMTAAVLHLSDFRPRPAWKTARSASPAYTEGSTGDHYLLPPDVAAMYDFVPANIGGNQKSIVGTTQVAVVGQSYVNTLLGASVVTNFSIYATPLGPSVTVAKPILVPGSGVAAISLGDEGESELDLEYINTAGAAYNPFFVYVGDNSNYSVFDSLGYAIGENLAPVISISYSICEPLLTSTELDQWNALFEQASAQGQTIVASAGDSGSTGCSGESTASGVTATERQSPAVSFPASSPNVTAVGGTQMTAGSFAAGNTQYWSPSGNPVNTESLLSYVPEVAWNEGSVARGIVAGGGGASSYFPRPAWQAAFPGMPAGSYRLLPDVALQSSDSDPGYVLCTDDPTLLAENGQTASCTNGLVDNNGKLTIAGGTSFAAPIFAGMIALLNTAERATGQGNINPQLFSLAATPATYAAAFHDIASGTTSCVAGASECSTASQGDYAAGTGYDEATGLGSVDFNALLAAWPQAGTATLLPTATVILTPLSDPYAGGETVSLQIEVGPYFFTDGLPLPTGGVSVAVDDAVVDSSLPFSSSTAGVSMVYASYSLVIPAAPGYHLVTVSYAGDAKHAPSSATYPILVGSVMATGSFSLSVGNVAIPNGSTAKTQVTVTPSGGYDGEVVWSLAQTGGSSTPLSGCYAIEPLVVNNISTATLTLGVGSACNAKPSYRGRLPLGTPRKAQSTLLPGSMYAGLLLCGCLAACRRRWRGMLLLALALGAAVAGPVACGGGGSSSGSTAGASSPTTPASTSASYTMVLTGKDSVSGTITSSGSFTLTVN